MRQTIKIPERRKAGFKNTQLVLVRLGHFLPNSATRRGQRWCERPAGTQPGGSPSAGGSSCRPPAKGPPQSREGKRVHRRCVPSLRTPPGMQLAHRPQQNVEKCSVGPGQSRRCLPRAQRDPSQPGRSRCGTLCRCDPFRSPRVQKANTNILHFPNEIPPRTDVNLF